MLLPLLVAPLLVLAGVMALLASRHLGAAANRDADRDRAAPARLSAPERLAVRMTEGLGRTALAVEVMVERRGSQVVPHDRRGDPDARRTDLVVVGSGLLGLGVVTALGALLLRAG